MNTFGDMNFTDLEYALNMDANDPLKSYRDKFYIPKQTNGQPCYYFCGNSLGLQPKTVKDSLNQELEDWKNLGVEGHFEASNPWLPYHEFLTDSMAKIVGAKPAEVVVMNSLTVNLHLMMVSFYRPTAKRHKIVIESKAFPSDQYAVKSQIEYHGYDIENSLIELIPEKDSAVISQQQIEELIEDEGDSIALIMIGGVNYYSGQVFDMKSITTLGHAKGCVVGFDLAHAVGNIDLQLHDWDVDFAVWCTYKYLNSGPGGVGGCFVNERHFDNKKIPRFAGWWGQNKETRFLMEPDFNPIASSEGWQLSNAPILSMASLKASLEIFDQVGMKDLLEKSTKLTGYLLDLLDNVGDERLNVISPREPSQRGCQLSIEIQGYGKQAFEILKQNGVIADWREPNIIRLAPVPLYNTFEEMWQFVEIVKKILRS